MTQQTSTSLGELISVVYEEFLALYGDRELASVATAALINDMLSAPEAAPGAEEGAAA